MYLTPQLKRLSLVLSELGPGNMDLKKKAPYAEKHSEKSNGALGDNIQKNLIPEK